MQQYKVYIQSREAMIAGKQLPDEFHNIDVKETVHNSLKQLLEEVISTNQNHYKVKYLNRANEWYKTKMALIDVKQLKKPIPPAEPDSKVTRKLLKKQKSILKQKEEVEKDVSPRKKIKVERNNKRNYIEPQ